MGRIVTLFFCSCLATMSADNKGRATETKGNQGNVRRVQRHRRQCPLRHDDVHVIQQYYRAHPVSLPPGLQKKLARGKPLPPGWQKKLQPFPSNIDVRLGPPCGYCGRGVIDGYGVIYDKKTAIILDIVHLVGDILR